jgi:hypothetical protein
VKIERMSVRAPSRQDKSVPVLAGELWQLSVAYLRQETVVPIKGLARFVAWGVAGSVSLAVGLLFLSLALLRALQTETGSVFTGHLSWVPYVITLAAAGGAAAAAGMAIGRGQGGKK